MKWLALTFGGDGCASSHFRVRQYVPLLKDLGIELVCRKVSDLCLVDGLRGAKDLRAYDGVLLQKKLLGWPLRWQIALSGIPVVFDTDDATWQAHSKKHRPITRLQAWHRLRAMMRLADRVLAANACLKKELRSHDRQVEVFPMTLPSAEWTCATSGDGPVVLGWAGDPSNHIHLQHIEGALREVKRLHPEVVVRVFSGSRPALDLDFDYVQYHPDRQNEILKSFSIGLLPLPDLPFNHSKSPIKALQYMAAGVPCVATALSGTKEMQGEGECGLFATDDASWTAQLLRLIQDGDLRRQLGQQSRRRYETLYTTEGAAVRLAGILKETKSRPLKLLRWLH